MPRPVKLRPVYTKDIGYLCRLLEAVEQDERINRGRVMSAINALIQELMQADTLIARTNGIDVA